MPGLVLRGNFVMEKIRRHIVFSGYVQGVGFRYRAMHSARRFGITGWVRNLDDGSVEMEAEGYPEDLDAMLLALEQHIWGHIEDIRARRIPLQNDRDFEIRG